MHILAVSDVYFPRINGVSTSIATFHRELETLGHRTTLLAPAYPGGAIGRAESAPRAAGLRVERIPSRRVPLDAEDRMMVRRELLRRGAALAREEPDVVHVQTPFVAHGAGLRLARAFEVPVVATYHTFFEEYLFHYVPFLPRPLLRALARRFSRRQCEEVDAVVVPSRAMEETLRRYGVRNRIERIPTGLRLGELAGGDGLAFRRRHDVPAQRPVLLHVGRIAFEKNVGFLLDVLEAVVREVPDALLVIAGEGPARPALERRVATLGLGDHVLFVGYLGREGELQSCYRAADAFVFASRTETQGLVLLEAMACGVPVVSTAVMGTRDILEPGRGALVAEETVADFAGHAVRLLRDSWLRHRLGEGAARYVAECWQAGTMAERLAALYRELAATPWRRAAGVDAKHRAA